MPTSARSFRLSKSSIPVAMILHALWLMALAALGAWVALFFAGLGWRLDIGALASAWPWTALGLLCMTLGWAAWRRSVRWLFSREARGFLAWTSALVLSAGVLYYSVEKWRGNRVWVDVEKRLSERGENLDPRSLAPPVVSPDEDFAQLPLFAPLFDYVDDPIAGRQWRDEAGLARLRDTWVLGWGWHHESSPMKGDWLTQQPADLKAAIADRRRGNQARKAGSQDEAARIILEQLTVYGEALDAVVHGSLRPYARFPVAYEKGLMDPLPHYQILLSIGGLLRLRATARLALGDSETALADARAGLRLVDYLTQQPCVAGSYYLYGLTISAVQPVWEGLLARRWTEAQLQVLDQELARPDLLAHYAAQARVVALAQIAFYDQLFGAAKDTGLWARRASDHWGAQALLSALRFVYPQGWRLQNQALVTDYFQGVSEVLDLPHRLFRPDSVPRFLPGVALDPLVMVFIVPRLKQHGHQLPLQFAHAQTALDLASVACALERFRLRHQHFPEALPSLVPDFLHALPTDVCTGEPLRYRRLASSDFLLYAVGWDQQDGGGRVAYARVDVADPRAQLEQGDWIWAYKP